MKINRELRRSLIASALIMSLSQTSVMANENMTKPSGAVGKGLAKVGQAKNNLFWWPEQVDLSRLRDHDIRSNPLGENFNYKQAFAKLDMKSLKADINSVLTDSQQW